MMKLYWAPQSRAFRALWMMEEAGCDYERVLIDIRKGAQATPAFRSREPDDESAGPLGRRRHGRGIRRHLRLCRGAGAGSKSGAAAGRSGARALSALALLRRRLHRARLYPEIHQARAGQHVGRLGQLRPGDGCAGRGSGPAPLDPGRALLRGRCDARRRSELWREHLQDRRAAARLHGLYRPLHRAACLPASERDRQGGSSNRASGRGRQASPLRHGWAKFRP